nr:tetratricopeptide repeat protein [Paraglaciecola sp. G1-23]
MQVVSVLGSVMVVSPLVGPATFLLLACGFPVAIYLAWHFDFSFDGISRTPSLDQENNPTIKPLGWLNWAALCSVVLISGFVGVQYFDSIKYELQATQKDLATVKLADSIAVLPFTDQSPEQNQSYLALGLAEEITSLLGRSEGFTVSASRSSQILAEKGLTPVDIGRRLEVKTVLTGSVRAQDRRLKIRVELLDTETGHALWTETFLRELKDIFAVESEIGRAIVNLLQDKYLEAGSFNSLASTNSTDAYVMYLKGREQYRKQTTESMKKARQFFEQALALDPEYAKAYVGLADTLVLLAEGELRFGVIQTDIAAALAQQNIDKALVRQPEMAEAYAVKGYISFMQNKFDDAIEDYNKAIQLNPSLAIAYMWKYLTLNSLQRFNESFSALEKSLELDPLFLTGAYNWGFELTYLGRIEEAEKVFKQLKTDFPDSTFSYQGLADMYFSQGDFVGAIRESQKAMQLSPDNQELAYKFIGPLIQLGLTDIVKGMTGSPVLSNAIEHYFENILIFENKIETLFDRMKFKLDANPDDYWVHFEAGWYQAMFGDNQLAYSLLTEKINLIDQSEVYLMPHCSPAIEIAWALLELGSETEAISFILHCKKLLDEQLQSSISYFELDYLTARIFAMQAEPQKAIQALSKAIDNGWREWWTKHDPLLQNLSQEAEFKKLIQFIDNDLARQRIEAAVLFAE